MKIANTIRSSQVHISVIVEITSDGQSELPRKIASETLTANGQMKERLKLMGVMTLDDAIRNAEEVAEEREKDARFYTFSRPDNHRKESCEKCAAEYRQLAEWLKDYRRLLERGSCNEILSKIREEIHKLHKEGILLGLEYKMIDEIIEKFYR